MLEDLKPIKVQPKCKVGRFYDELEAKDQKLLQGYLEDLDFSAEQLSIALKQRVQSDIGATVIRKHRKGQCPCTKLS
jgi:hypothetical protein